MKTIRDIGFLEGVVALVRVDFNVPLKGGAVAEGFRVRMALPTIEFLRAKGAKVVLISHIESNADGSSPSLEPVARYMASELGLPVEFVAKYKEAAAKIAALSNGGCILLENLRFFEGEKANDPAFARELASLADLYVNDAFSVSHREHASVVGVPKLLPSYAGFQLEKEIEHLSHAFKPAHPFLFVLGGAKFETKLSLLAKFIDSADSVYVGGALANDFFKAKGYMTGASLLSKGNIDLSAYIASPKLMLPLDVVLENHSVKAPGALASQDKMLDAGPATIAALAEQAAKAKFILWNGPLGLYEGGYTDATLAFARSAAAATRPGVETIVGGGDTLAAISKLGNEDKFSFISTGGGAMLDFLAKGSLPGIDALSK